MPLDFGILLQLQEIFSWKFNIRRSKVWLLKCEISFTQSVLKRWIRLQIGFGSILQNISIITLFGICGENARKSMEKSGSGDGQKSYVGPRKSYCKSCPFTYPKHKGLASSKSFSWHVCVHIHKVALCLSSFWQAQWPPFGAFSSCVS